MLLIMKEEGEQTSMTIKAVSTPDPWALGYQWSSRHTLGALRVGSWRVIRHLVRGASEKMPA